MHSSVSAPVSAVHKRAPGVVITFNPSQSEYGRWVFTSDINDVPPAPKQ